MSLAFNPDQCAFRTALQARADQLGRELFGLREIDQQHSGLCAHHASSFLCAARMLSAGPGEIQMMGGSASFRIHTDEEAERDEQLPTHFSYQADESLSLETLLARWNATGVLPEMHCWLMLAPAGTRDVWLFDPTAHHQPQQARRLMKANPTVGCPEPLWMKLNDLRNRSEDALVHYRPSLHHTKLVHLLAVAVAAQNAKRCAMTAANAVQFLHDSMGNLKSFSTEVAQRL